MKGVNYISIGYNFLKLSSNSIDELIEQGNKTSIYLDGDTSDSEANLVFEEKTKWNSLNIGIPILFTFFHGIELILKGLIIHCGGQLNNKTHKLSELLIKLKNCPNCPSTSLINHFETILNNNGLEDFFEANNKNVDSFYILFKYPEMNNGESISFQKVREKNTSGIVKFDMIRILAMETKGKIEKWKTSA